MKFVPKLQGGGFLTYAPFMPTIPGYPRNTKTAETTEATSILDDDTFKELLTKGGLVNDVNQLVSELSRLESSSSLPYMQGNNRISALKMIGKINELRQNKTL